MQVMHFGGRILLYIFPSFTSRTALHSGKESLNLSTCGEGFVGKDSYAFQGKKAVRLLSHVRIAIFRGKIACGEG